MKRPSCSLPSPIHIVSLFSGPGGLDLGFENAGFEIVLALDRSEVAVKTFNRNLPAVAKAIDLAKASDEEVVSLVTAGGRKPSGVIGGPPCQGFSLANVSQRRVDPRRRLTLRFAELVGALDRAFRLDFFVMENVAALAMPKQRSLFRRLRQRFERLGFTTYVTVANARDFGVAQNRSRLFVVGIKSKLARFAAFEFPPALAGDPKTVRQVIEHLPLPVYFNRDLTPKDIPFHENHWTMVPRSAKFRPGALFDGYVRPAKGSRSFKRLEWDTQSPTVAYGHRELHLHPKGTRRVTILEAMLLQGFPQGFKFAGNLSEQVTQVSDAVPPPLAEAMARGVHASLYRRRLKVQSALTAYHRSAGRSALPWRRISDPFRILVAEKLLQQTAAKPVVVEAYASLLEQWPTATALARARVSDVRTILKPLGLPYRASELVSMSQALVRRYGGAVPLARGDLLSLPGIGAYAANAVLSFTRSQETAIVDTNIGRLLRRLFALETPVPPNPARSRSLYELASWLIAGAESSRELNYAALDLTAALCVAREPRCEGCPLRSLCVTGLSGIHDHGSLIGLGESTPLPVTRKGKQTAAGSRL